MENIATRRWLFYFVLLFSIVPLSNCNKISESVPKSDVDRAIAGLKNPDPTVRLKAARKLYGLKDRRALKPLIAALNDPDPEVGHVAANALVEIPDIRTAELLIATLKDKSAPQSRLWAAVALGRIKNPVAVDPLIVALNDPNAGVRRGAVIALGEFGDSRTVQPLIGKLKDDSPDVRMAAAQALGGIPDPRMEPLIAALEDKSLQVRLKASQVLNEMADELSAAKEHPITDAFDSMKPEELIQGGEILIFGRVGGYQGIGTDGKGQCALCHVFRPEDQGNRAPNLFGVTKRAAERIKEPRYLHPNTVQTEAFPGSGRATTAMEYLAESNVCPNCYVVKGFGVIGTNDRESPYARINKPPINLSIHEMIMVNSWLYYHDGQTPPPAAVMRAAFEKFIPEKERVYEAGSSEEPVSQRPGAFDPEKFAVASDTPEMILLKMGCVACHRIPTIAAAKFGPIGPLLVLKTTAAKRIASPEYQVAVKAGIANATTPREYVIESIMAPNAFIVSGFSNINGESSMVHDYEHKFTFAAAGKLADFLLTLDEKSAMEEGLDRVPEEKEGSLYKREKQ